MKMIEGDNTLAQDFSSMYQTLAEQYAHIAGEHVTPEAKVQHHNLDHRRDGSDLSLSSGDRRLNNSLKESTGLPSLTSDSELEDLTSAINGYLEKVEQMNGLEQHQKKIDGKYEELIGKILQSEGEVMVLSRNLKLSEEEVSRLKSELNGRDNDVRDLQAQLEATKAEMEKKDEDLEEANGEIMYLESQLFDLETCFADSICEIQMLMNELKQTNKELEKANKDGALVGNLLHMERDHGDELQERISKYEKDAYDRENEIAMLRSMISEAEAKHRDEMGHLELQCYLLCNQVEDEFIHREGETKKIHDAHVRDMQDQINSANTVIEDTVDRMGCLSKKLEVMKLKYDTEVTAKDGLSVRVKALIEDVGYREDRNDELFAVAMSVHDETGKLKLRVKELEEEVEVQRVMVLDGAEKKREAIRQLCLLMDYYRTKYHELCRKLHGRRAIVSS